MSTEDQAILAQISQVAGLINRHKNQQQSDPYQDGILRLADITHVADYTGDPSQISPGWRSPRAAYAGRGRGFSRGGRLSQVHRNRSLVLNGGASTTSSLETTKLDPHSDIPLPTTFSPAWVTKTDRHLQLINSAVYEKQSQRRTKAIEATRKLKLRQRDELERLKLSKHLYRLGDLKDVPATESAALSNHEILVHGMRFRVVNNGSKLAKASGDEKSSTVTPKTANIGGVMFYRSKNGNLYRSGIVKAHRRHQVAKKINEPCKAFSTTGTCLKGPKCRYIHDPSRVAICKDFLQKGACPVGESCDLSHHLTPERTPACLHFAKGNCSNPNCRYTHIRVSPSALVCRPFGIYGYCEKGLNCADRHVHECPDFSNTGACDTKGCKLLHRYKASVIRKNPALAEQQVDAESSDVSSDEEQDEIDSDDVDSDDIDEEYFGQEDIEKDPDIPAQQDFVQLS